ncbi:MAG: DUF4395 domain-containing protein, partial [Chitinophagaceae bacterium]|nr:DUF4395 domain-containing protein [Chitinophagaceae bacterium]
MLNNIICPVSFKKVDINVSRLTVFLNAVLMAAFLITLQPVLLYVVAIDYGIRAMGYNQYSPICILSSNIIKLTRIKPEMRDKAPKVFASRLGLICAVLGCVFMVVNMPIAASIVIGFFTVLAVLDSVFDLCVGCLI